MKNRASIRLAWGFVLSLAAYLFIVLAYLEIIDLNLPLDWYTFREFSAYFTIAFPALPAFCLQLLLCRSRCWTAVKALPLFLILSAALLAGCGWMIAAGWDSLGWLILLILLIAPAAGCILALAFHHLRELYKRGDIRG